MSIALPIRVGLDFPFVVLMCPLAILIVGLPVALLVRLLIEIAGRL